MKKLLITGIFLAILQLNFAGIAKDAGVILPANGINKTKLFHLPKIAHIVYKNGIKKADHRTNSEKFFKLQVKQGEMLGNIFTRTISYNGDGFPEVVSRNGGTGIYTVIDNNPLKPVFDGVLHYDGRPESKGRVEISDTGKTNIFNGKSYLNTDGSGVMFNSLIRGNPPGKIAVTPDTSHWIGYTMFKNGLVISDELLVSRPVTLTADNLKFDAVERKYILLNAMPVL